jgi:hypothetical protein
MVRRARTRARLRLDRRHARTTAWRGGMLLLGIRNLLLRSPRERPFPEETPISELILADDPWEQAR